MSQKCLHCQRFHALGDILETFCIRLCYITRPGKNVYFPASWAKFPSSRADFLPVWDGFPYVFFFFPLQIPHLGTTFPPLFLKVLLRDNFKTFFEGFFWGRVGEGRMYGSYQDLGVPAANYGLNVYII